MSITIELPETVERQLASSWGILPEQLPQRFLESVVADGYRTGVLSLREAGRILDLEYWETEQFFRDRGIPVPNYAEQDYYDDITTIEQRRNNDR